ncbi:MAG: tRNA-specific adenosine deaminase subunit tad3 [Piccolia ochrophora]|nr:MAG: tRNA-specific adenosine deaminase subunit tad3 [Piccolia ochrophora]
MRRSTVLPDDAGPRPPPPSAGFDLSTLTPKKGTLVPLKTRREVEAEINVELVDAQVVAIPAKSAHAVLTALRSHVPSQTEYQFSHLRRLIRTEHLPTPLRPSNFPTTPTLHLILPPPTTLPASLTPLLPTPHPPPSTVRIPLNPPTTPHQASHFSQTYWPTLHSPTSSPYGPAPQLVARATGDLAPCAGTYLALASRVAHDAVAAGIGEPIGVVVVEPRSGRVVAVAGDARYAGEAFAAHGSRGGRGRGRGNPLAHATLRAIGMVARGRLNGGSPSPTASATTTTTTTPSAFHDTPLLPLEAAIARSAPSILNTPPGNADPPPNTPNGNATAAPTSDASVNGANYLCVDLTLYATHEPCVACAMAMLHSRLGRAVFARPLERTGGLAVRVRRGGGGESDGGGEGDGGGAPCDEETAGRDGSGRVEGYGLFWRRELNWKMGGWRFVEEEGEGKGEGEGRVGEDVHA